MRSRKHRFSPIRTPVPLAWHFKRFRAYLMRRNRKPNERRGHISVNNNGVGSIRRMKHKEEKRDFWQRATSRGRLALGLFGVWAKSKFRFGITIIECGHGDGGLRGLRWWKGKKPSSVGPENADASPGQMSVKYIHVFIKRRRRR